MGNLTLCSYIIFFFTLHVPTLESVNFKVIGPDHPITVSAGEDALLPCHLSPSMNAQEMEVRWFQSKFSELVYLYQHGKDQTEVQISKYRGRTELLKDGIVDGRVALHIRNITPSDQGQFICFFRSPSFHGEATLELKVTEKLQNELQLRRAQIYQASVILDPITAHPDLILSEDHKCVTKGDTAQNVPDNPERFDSSVCVLGSEGFTSGIHYWEVEVGNGGDWWVVGVARESIRRKGWLNFSPVEKIWAVECDWGKYQALDSSVIHLPLNERLGKIGVSLNFEEHHVAFYDTDNMVAIYTFKEVSFSDEKIFPFFCVWRTPGKYMKLCDREKR
ncbi:butyrophilin subfamily 1 member A1-like isoform X2 [Lepidochelys kempii]|uniref:butyrophilin subfamily 1 member A1-like isoform X2 n=1 Tax=Lepidochelys kempii TaxID=8472 RepID=UPI003C6FA8A1